MASNPIDTSKLEQTIAEAESFFAQVKDVSDGGLYEDGTYEALAQSITTAKAVLNDLESQDQVSINRTNAVLANAIWKAKVNKEIQYVTFDPFSADAWKDYHKSTAVIQMVDGELQISNDSSTEAIYDPGVGLRDILCFQFKQENFSAWWGFALAQTNTSEYITDAQCTDGYLLCFSGNQIELQKRNGGNNFGNLAVVTNDGLFEAGKWYDLQMGAINNADGSVRIYFKINDTVVFDYTDSDAVISNVDNFGIVIKKDNGIYSVKPAELEEKIDVTVDKIGAETAGVVVHEPEGGWKEGSNTFTISANNNTNVACVVAVKNADGTYSRVTATKTETEGVYSYAVNGINADTEIAVAVAGDVNGDGKVTNADITRLRAAYAGKIDLDALQEIVADANGSGSITNADITKLRAAYAGKTKLDW